MERNIFNFFYLVIRYRLVTPTASKTLWVPERIHATQKSSMANVGITPCTDPITAKSR